MHAHVLFLLRRRLLLRQQLMVLRLARRGFSDHTAQEKAASEVVRKGGVFLTAPILVAPRPSRRAWYS
jgi:hypothetical protein